MASLMLYQYNDMTDHDIDVAPGEILEELNNFNYEYFNKKLQIVEDLDKQNIKILKPDENLEVKIKFFEVR